MRPIVRLAAATPFPPIESALEQPNGLLAYGGDLSVARLLNAYSQGIFPWYAPGEPILWWSPDPRCVFVPQEMHVPRRLSRWLKAYDWRIEADADFAQVMRACAAPRGKAHGTWITSAMLAAYHALHERGYAHSIEVREGEELVGGLYGVAIDRVFFAESMFSVRTNASKVALLALAQRLAQWQWPLIDAQVESPHLFTLGARAMARANFKEILGRFCAHLSPMPDFRNRFGIALANELH